MTDDGAEALSGRKAVKIRAAKSGTTPAVFAVAYKVGTRDPAK